MQITSNIYTIEGITAPLSGWKFLGPRPRQTSTKFYHTRYPIWKPIVIVNGNELTLFDAGTPESLPKFKECIEGLGFKLQNVKNIIISHANVDHVGELKHLVDMSGAKVYAHVEEAPYVEKKIPGSRDNRPFEAVKVDVLLKEGDILDILDGIKVIYTPGHTPGHISLYSIKKKILLAADLVRYSQETFHLCPPQYSVDYTAIVNSMIKVAQYDFDILVPYHGEPLIGGAGDKYREFIEYQKAISDLFLPDIKEALAPEMEG